jgi:hypothetical protein
MILEKITHICKEKCIYENINERIKMIKSIASEFEQDFGILLRVRWK